MFAELSDAQADLDSIAGGIRGRLRLGSFPTATVAFTAAAMNTFRRGCPDVEIYFADGEPCDSVMRLKNRELDLAVLFDLDNWAAATNDEGRAVCDGHDLEYVDLFDDPFDVVLPREHRLVNAERIGLGDLAGERVIGGPPICSPWGDDFRLLCQQAGFEPDFESQYRSADFAALQAIVATGRGITLVPGLAQPLSNAGTVSRPLDGGPVRHVRIAALTNVAQSAACIEMIAVLKATAAPLLDRTQPGRWPWHEQAASTS